MIGTIVGTYYASRKGAGWGKAACIGIGIDAAIGIALVAVPLAVGMAAAAGASLPSGASTAVTSGLQGLGQLNATRLGSRAAAALVRHYRPGLLPPQAAAPSTTLAAGFSGCRGC